MAAATPEPPGTPQRTDRRVGLKRHLAWVVAAKRALLALLYILFFGPASRPDIDGDAVGQRLHTSPR